MSKARSGIKVGEIRDVLEVLLPTVLLDAMS